MAKKSIKYVCQNCGYESPGHYGKCPECQTWGSMIEELYDKKSQAIEKVVGKIKNETIDLKPLSQVEMLGEERSYTGIEELDRVLGGGLVKGSLVLIGGDPGIGKSTLLLQVSHNLSSGGKKVLYISGEESVSQIAMRARRLGVLSNTLYVVAATDMDLIEAQVAKIEPEFLIVDSIQTVQNTEIQSLPGSVTQIKDATGRLMKISKEKGISSFIVGHVTKEGALAGPRVLEHMVDCVLYFEGERYNSYRMIRAVKNRFGSTNELGLFEMRDGGLIGVANPSEVLISEKPQGVPGSVIVSTLEGTRPMLVEIQALVAPTSFGIPRRTATGVDLNRLNMLLAVLEKRGGVKIQNQDVYVNLVGGIKILEPALDLGVLMAVASSYVNMEIPPEVAFFGEVGLTGEIRGVGFSEKRIRECMKMGFKRVLMPYNNSLECKKVGDLEIVGVKNIQEALRLEMRRGVGRER